MQEYSNRYFNEISVKFSQLTYKSELHSKKFLNKMSFINFINTYICLLDCLLKKYHSDLKQNSEGIHYF